MGNRAMTYTNDELREMLLGTLAWGAIDRAHDVLCCGHPDENDTTMEARDILADVIDERTDLLKRIPIAPSAEAKPEKTGKTDAIRKIVDEARAQGREVKMTSDQPTHWLGDCEPTPGADPPNALQGLFLANAENQVLSLRAALIETIRNSSEVDTVRRAALALINPEQPAP